MFNTSLITPAPVDMDLDHEQHPFTMANWSQLSNHGLSLVISNKYQPTIGWFQARCQERTDII